MNANYVKAAGGCSAPSLADMMLCLQDWENENEIHTNLDLNSLSKAEFLISHPNYFGLQFNQLTRAEIPAHFVNYVKIEQDNEVILEAFPDISLSEDPSITFHYLNTGGPLSVKVEDSEGKNFAKIFQLLI